MMRVVSVNKGESRTVKWRGRSVKTGIFKFPVEDCIFLGATDVEGDSVIDRKYHGGVNKAVYAYGSDHYPFWKEKYPNLNWTNGMFGENLTIEGLDETALKIGSRYKVGDAEIQVSEPRQPCFKLGIRFGTQSVLKPFVNSTFCGTYFRVNQPGSVGVGDELTPLEIKDDNPTIAEIYSLIYQRSTSADLVQTATDCQDLAENIRQKIQEVQLDK